jgi:hypothetical protein
MFFIFVNFFCRNNPNSVPEILIQKKKCVILPMENFFVPRFLNV